MELSKPRKSSKSKKSSSSGSKSKSKPKSNSTKSKTSSSPSKVKKHKKKRSSSFDTLTDCHKALLKIALRKGLYPEIKLDFEGARHSVVLDYIHKHISRKADKAITRIYQAIEKKSCSHSKLARSPGAARATVGGDEVAQSSA